MHLSREKGSIYHSTGPFSLSLLKKPFVIPEVKIDVYFHWCLIPFGRKCKNVQQFTLEVKCYFGKDNFPKQHMPIHVHLEVHLGSEIGKEPWSEEKNNR